MNKSFVVNAFFSGNKFEDSTIVGIVGRPSLSGATFTPDSAIRRMDFEFIEEGAAKKALIRLKKKGIKAEIVEI